MSGRFSWLGRVGLISSVGIALLVAAVTTPVCAEDKASNPPGPADEPQFNFLPGPLKAQLGRHAEIQVPAKYGFLDAGETRKFLSALDNIPNGSELGCINPANEDWFVVFEFSDVGYIKDDEKDSLDADAILSTIREGTEEGNKERASRGIPPMHVTGWKFPPSYDPTSHNLQWCIAAESEGRQILNYNTRILGRNGVMEATLVCSPDELDTVVAKYKSLIGGFQYIPGSKYGEYRTGDKVAAYGLTALVAGGGLAAAAKTGLLGKLGALIAKGGKVIIVAVIGLFMAVKAFFGKMFGKKQRPAA